MDFDSELPGGVIGIAVLSKEQETTAQLTYIKQTISNPRISAVVFYGEHRPALMTNSLGSTMVQFVDLGPKGLDLVSELEPDSSFSFPPWAYISLTAALSGISDLTIICPEAISLSTLDLWFDAAHDAGVRTFHCFSDNNLSTTSSYTLNTRLLDFSRRAQDLGGEMSIYTYSSGAVQNLVRASKFEPQNESGRASDELCDLTYRQEIDAKIETLQSAKDALSEEIDELDNWDDESERPIRMQMDNIGSIIRRLRKRRNGFAPIFRLPPEILCHVFIMASYNIDTYRNYPPTLAWVKISHVCRHWSDVSRNTPHVWTNVPAIVPLWTEAFLKRSQSMPLRVHYKWDHITSDQTQSDSLNIALRHLDRIAELSIEVSCLNLELYHPAPILDSFELTAYHNMGATLRIDRLFCADAPRLRRMSLRLASFDLRSPLFSNLTFLELEDANIGVHTPMGAFLEFLARIRSLQELRLRDTIHRLLLSPTGEIVPLPSLQKLLLHDTYVATCAEFLSRISIGHGSQQSIPTLDLAWVVRASTSQRESRRYLKSITRLCRHSVQFLHSVRISQHKESGVLLEGWTAVDGPFMERLKPELSLWLRLNRVDRGLTKTTLQQVFSLLPFRDIFVVAVNNMDSEGAWSSAIGLLPNVHVIYLESSPPEPLLSALHRDFRGESVAPFQTLTFLPALHILLFRNAPFGDGATKAKRLRKLEEILMKRQEIRNSRIVHVQFDQCHNITREDALSLREVVPDVNIAWAETFEDEDSNSDDDFTLSDDDLQGAMLSTLPPGPHRVDFTSLLNSMGNA